MQVRFKVSAQKSGKIFCYQLLVALLLFVLCQATDQQPHIQSPVAALSAKSIAKLEAAKSNSQQHNELLPQLAFARNFVKLGNSAANASARASQLTSRRLANGSSQAETQSDIAATHLHQALGQQHQQQQQPQQKRAGLMEKICHGTSNKLASQHNSTDHYQNLVERYRNCTYVIGNLELTWLEHSNSSPVDLSFLESIREITGYLLIAHTEVETIRMPNLQIIRGRDLFKFKTEDNDELAMVLIKNERLKRLELPNLREILAGNVGSFNNSQLCHIQTINWDEILNWPTYGSVFVYNGTVPECPACDPACQGSCWSSDGPEMCQKFSKNNCSPQCKGGRCFGPSPAECCHSSCAGGCTGPKQGDCLACKNFYDNGECIQECPSMMRYNPSKFLWEHNPNGKYTFGATCVRECPEHLLRDNGACVRTCPPNKRSINGECVACGGPCPKNCQGVEVVHSGNIDHLINCTIIEGSIAILDSSFSGHVESSAAATTNANGSALVSPLKAMHPKRLEVFKTLREITGSLTIQASHPDFKNLTFFRYLQTIGGRQSTDMIYSLSIVSSSLVSLNLRALRKVRSGRILIEDNRDLCFADTIDWLQANITRREDITTRNNAEPSKCRQLGLRCHEQCAQDGCWGPGPDECLSCNNYKLDDYCVANCANSAHSVGFLSYDSGGRICKKCHPECRDGCTGPEARHCRRCRSVKDGPYCVSECPSHKYNNEGTCEECDRGCLDGCTGPSAHLGEGGCNSCAKAIINSTAELSLSASCIKAEESCPDGYYQEYVGPQAEGPLKSSSGKPVCRKCHHRCKSCTGMGTHVSICECAKYAAGEQCEDFCPRDYFADEQLGRCVRCSPECNGCFGPTEADCITCRIYRVYYETATTPGQLPEAQRVSINQLQHQTELGLKLKFNCTAQCPSDKPHRISESNMLDPYCSDEPSADSDSPHVVPLGLPTSLLFIFIISASMAVCFSVYRFQKEKDKTVKLTMHLSGIDDVEPLTPSNMKPNLAPLRSIKQTELRRGNVLGSGFGGTVYQGLWYPEHGTHKEPYPVAIKVLRDNGQSNMHKEFLEEAFIMNSVNHPNLVRLLAVCMTPAHLMLVTPLMPLGCLLEYVRKHRQDIGSKNLLEWCKQIARGMSYLEEKRMVHRDLALRNVLLQKSGRALISDFGLAKLLDHDQSEYHSGGGRLPIKWLAPECIRQRKFTHKSDVWAFGVTVWELLTFGQRPFEDYEPKDVPVAVERGARLQQPAHMSAEVYKVMYACWFYDPDARPNFRTLTQNFVDFAGDPGRYLPLVGCKGIDYTQKRRPEELSEPEETDSEVNSDQDNCCDTSEFTEEEHSPQPMSANLTPSTHNRINEIFGFDVRHNQTAHHGDNLPTPVLKKLISARGMHDDDVFMSASRKQLVTDANNNNLAQNAGWSLRHSMSATSIACKPEQPTDVYDYLLPSPCTQEHSHFASFYNQACEPKSTPITPTRPVAQVNPQPHSAGVTNEEYFMNSAHVSYVNQSKDTMELMHHAHHHHHVHHLSSDLMHSTSSGDIPNSLV